MKTSLLTLLIIPLFFFTNLLSSADQTAHMKNGLLDLRKNISGEPLEIIGNAFFIDKTFIYNKKNIKNYQHIQIPGLWENELNKQHTHGTYYFKVLLPEGDDRWAIKMPMIESAYRVVINHKITTHCGIPGHDKKSTLTCQRPEIIHLNSDKKKFDVMIQMTNYDSERAGFWKKIYIGHDTKIVNKRNRMLAMDIFFFGSILFFGLYHFILYIIQRKNITLLYFAVFACLIALRISFTNEHFISIFFSSIELMTEYKITLFTLYISAIIFFVFFDTTYKNYVPKFLIRAIQISGITFLALIVFEITTDLIYMKFFQLLCFIGGGFMIYGLFKETLKKNYEALVFLIGFSIFFVTMVNDFLFYSQLSNYQDIAPAGIFILIISQSTLLAMRYNKAFTKTKKLSSALQEKTNEVEHKNSELIKYVHDHQRTQYQLMQKRISPHFLFNALNSIHSMLLRNPESADTAILKLADNYRFLMEHSTNDLISFESEWDFVKNYIDLEMIRFGDTLTFEITKNESLHNIMIPPLSIQPLVENAIKHGLQSKIGGGTIKLTALKENNSISVTVADNGKGLTKKNLFTRSLGDIKKRLKYHYPDSELKLSKADPQGVIVSLRFTA